MPGSDLTQKIKSTKVEKGSLAQTGYQKVPIAIWMSMKLRY